MIRSYSVEDLQTKFGKSTGLYIYNISRGIDDAEGKFHFNKYKSALMVKRYIVSPTKAPKSLMAAKSLPVPISNIAGMERWYKILSIELRSRILQNFEEYGSWPKSVSVIYH